MPAIVSKNMGSADDLIAGIRQLQAYLSRPVTNFSDPQGIAAEIIKLQTHLSTVNAAGQPSGKKFDPTKIAKSIDDQYLSARLSELQVAADLT